MNFLFLAVVFFTTHQVEADPAATHPLSRQVSDFLANTIKSETNANLLQQYAHRFMKPQPVNLLDEFTDVTSLIGRKLYQVVSADKALVNVSEIDDSYHGYAFTSLLSFIFGKGPHLSVTSCSQLPQINDVIKRSLPAFQWFQNFMNSERCDHSVPKASKYHLIVHVCNGSCSQFELPQIQNCASSPLVDFVSVQISKKSCANINQTVTSFTPCMISRYACIDRSPKEIVGDHSARNDFAAAVFNTSAFSQWLKSFSLDRPDVKALKDVMAGRKILDSQCSANNNRLLMSLPFVNQRCCVGSGKANSDFYAVATFVCQENFPTKSIDTSNLALLLNYRLHFGHSTLGYLIDIDAKSVVIHPLYPFFQSIPFDELGKGPFANDVLLPPIINAYFADILDMQSSDNTTSRQFTFHYNTTASPQIAEIYAHRVLFTQQVIFRKC